MNWTTEKPSRSGLYWMRECCDLDTILVYVEVLGTHLEWKQNAGDDWNVIESDDSKEWASHEPL